MKPQVDVSHTLNTISFSSRCTKRRICYPKKIDPSKRKSCAEQPKNLKGGLRKCRFLTWQHAYKHMHCAMNASNILRRIHIILSEFQFYVLTTYVHFVMCVEFA